MRHYNGRRKLGRTTSHRIAMLRNMVTSLLLHGQIRTTDAKAKEVRRVAEKIITLSKRVPTSQLNGLTDPQEIEKAKAARLHAIRLARHWVQDKGVLTKIFDEYGDVFAGRNGGYTRVLKIGVRAGDNAPMSLVELVTAPVAAPAAAPAPAEPQA